MTSYTQLALVVFHTAFLSCFNKDKHTCEMLNDKNLLKIEGKKNEIELSVIKYKKVILFRVIFC